MDQKVVLITGASSGIGKATALLLARKGLRVYGAARRLDRMKEIADAGVRLLSMDITNDNSVVKAVAEVMEAEKRIDVLVNNAGYGSYGALEDVPLSEARYQFEVNVFGLARITQIVLPSMRKRRSGTIINISSIGGKIGEPHGAWYHAAKFAVEGLSDSLRMELSEFGIDVVVIQPGAIVTEWNTIAREHLMKVSGGTAYGELARKHIAMMLRADQYGSRPDVVARTIAKAMESRRPGTRYPSGARARLALFARRLLSDRMFDSVMLGQMK